MAHRPDQVMPTCSVFKSFLVAALLHDRGDDREYWYDAAIDYDESDVVINSAVLSERSGPISPHDLAEAALRYSDNTAANLLLAELGGPAVLTEFTRSLGAAVTRFDRLEPELNAAVPGDDRDTSTPAEVAMLMHAVLVERSAGAYTAARLNTWMLWNETSRITEALRTGDELTDRTGAGAYGVVNDAGVLYRPGQPPRSFAVMTRTDDEDAENDDAVVLEAARLLLGS
ncbi:beta-lactamase class A [Allonocardiopsis opalescens]|uniref:Beta-lactamase class A n=1 Tax=Allonocardiopsis opalescens TaxID=1144618 RepID=A0A2T0QA86_9ACTN|nr:beta-lactamase class A [Allonocardiopsis opalescens]